MKTLKELFEHFDREREGKPSPPPLTPREAKEAFREAFKPHRETYRTTECLRYEEAYGSELW